MPIFLFEFPGPHNLSKETVIEIENMIWPQNHSFQPLLLSDNILFNCGFSAIATLQLLSARIFIYFDKCDTFTTLGLISSLSILNCYFRGVYQVVWWLCLDERHWKKTLEQKTLDLSNHLSRLFNLSGIFWIHQKKKMQNLFCKINSSTL